MSQIEVLQPIAARGKKAASHEYHLSARRHSIMRGINAAVVGLLGAALYNPLWISSVKSSADFAIALIGFILLVARRASPLLVVILGALAGVAFV
jgi:chromate transporter